MATMREDEGTASMFDYPAIEEMDPSLGKGISLRVSLNN